MTYRCLQRLKRIARLSHPTATSPLAVWSLDWTIQRFLERLVSCQCHEPPVQLILVFLLCQFDHGTSIWLVDLVCTCEVSRRLDLPVMPCCTYSVLSSYFLLDVNRGGTVGTSRQICPMWPLWSMHCIHCCQHPVPKTQQNFQKRRTWGRLLVILYTTPI